MTFAEGEYELSVSLTITHDDNPENNIRKRILKVVC